MLAASTIIAVAAPQKWVNLLLRLVELLCEKKVKSKITEYVSREYFPIDETLIICKKKNATEACAVLYKRKGLYEKSIKQYIKVLDALSEEKIYYTLYMDPHVPFNSEATKNEHIRHFDNIILAMVKICDKYGSRYGSEIESENLWLFAMRGLYQVSDKLRQKLGGQEDDENAEEIDKFDIFMLIRKQVFLQKLSEHVGLRKIFDFFQELGHELKYDEFRKTFAGKVVTQTHTEKILLNAAALVDQDLLADYTFMMKALRNGCAGNQSKCTGCNMALIGGIVQQDLWLFQCGHCFHARCVEKTDGLCTICFNEVDTINSLLSVIRKAKSKSRRTVSNASSSSEADEAEISTRKRKSALNKSEYASEMRNTERNNTRETKEQKSFRMMKMFENDERNGRLTADNFKFEAIF